MSRLLFVYERDMPTMAITRDIFSNLDHSYGIVSEFKFSTDIKSTDIDNHDVIVFMRPNDNLSAKIAKNAVHAGKFVITFCDDDLAHYEPMAPWRKRALLKVLNLSEIIWSSSKYIGKMYSRRTKGKRYVITDTIIRSEQITDYDPDLWNNKETVKIVYAANPGHLSLFNEYARDALVEIVKEYKDRISLTFVGVKPDLSVCENLTDVRYLKGMPLLEYRQFMVDEKFDIGIAPLADNKFTKCKYFNKYLEYAMTGICGVYSNVEPYTNVIRSGENGFLTFNDTESWFDTLKKAIDDVETRNKCVIESQRNLRNYFTEDYIIENFIRDIPEMKTYRKKTYKCKNFFCAKFLYYFSRPLDWGYLAFYYIKNGGWSQFKEKFLIHFRENKAYSRKKIK